jgi:hypothetical protein
MLHTCNSFAYFDKGSMARCSPLGEIKKEIAAVILWMMKVGSNGRAPSTFEDEGCVSSGGKSSDSVDEGASGNANLWMYCFRASTITQGHVKEMANKEYFMDGEA